MRTQSRRSNRHTPEKYFYYLLGICIVIAFIFREDLFIRYFMFKGVIYEGQIFYYIYWAVTVLMSLWALTAPGKYRSVLYLFPAGITPAMSVLTIRWFLAGFKIAAILLIIFAAYILILVVQVSGRVIRKENVFRVTVLAVYKSGSVLIALSIAGALGFFISGFEYAEPVVKFEEAVSSVDRGWEYNTDMLRMWKEGIYADLNAEEKKQLWQALIDMESNYFGIEPPTVEIESYDYSSEYDGYYNKEKNLISISDRALDYPRKNVMNILLHEVNHAYTGAVADSVDWEDMNDPDRQLRMYVDAYAYKEAEMNYISLEENEEKYHNNALEIAARNYAEEWGYRYMQYIDSL